jgi:hypothetical protein
MTVRRRGLALGGVRSLDGSGETRAYELPADDLITHGVVVGGTGSGKTGLLVVMVEEAVLSRIPTILVDVKGDLPNLLLTFPELSAAQFTPWVDAQTVRQRGVPLDAAAEQLAADWRKKLAAWGRGPDDVAALKEAMAARVFTPGSQACEPLHVLSALERVSPLWETDLELARESLSATISLLLRLLGRNPDPTKSRDHVVLSIFAERRLRAGVAADVRALLEDVRTPPVAVIGAMPIEEFISNNERASLAAALNTLLASPTFEAWRMGGPLDVAEWLAPRDDARTPVVIVSVAHLDDDERQLVLGILLDQVLGWVRTQSGTDGLRALLVFDEVYGFAPPHPKDPPTKRPLVSLLKQARAFGLGVLVATQNPMDLDYRVLSNAGFWCVGRLSTDADRQRVVESMAHSGGDIDRETLTATIKSLAPRWFVMRHVKRPKEAALLQSRTTLCWLKGPMARADLRRLKG